MRYNGIIEGTTGDFDSEINKLKEVFQNADAIIVGAGAGLSSSAGYDFGGERLQKYFGDFVEKYGMKDMYTGCFADFETNEERWAYWSRWAWINRYEPIPKDTHKKLLKLLEGKDYFVLTTNIDHTFQRAGFSKNICAIHRGILVCSNAQNHVIQISMIIMQLFKKWFGKKKICLFQQSSFHIVQDVDGKWTSIYSGMTHLSEIRDGISHISGIQII